MFAFITNFFENISFNKHVSNTAVIEESKPIEVMNNVTNSLTSVNIEIDQSDFKTQVINEILNTQEEEEKISNKVIVESEIEHEKNTPSKEEVNVKSIYVESTKGDDYNEQDIITEEIKQIVESTKNEEKINIATKKVKEEVETTKKVITNPIKQEEKLEVTEEITQPVETTSKDENEKKKKKKKK